MFIYIYIYIYIYKHIHIYTYIYIYIYIQVQSVVEMAAYEGAPSDDRRLSAQLWVQVIGSNNRVDLCCGTHLPSTCALVFHGRSLLVFTWIASSTDVLVANLLSACLLAGLEATLESRGTCNLDYALQEALLLAAMRTPIFPSN